MNINTRILEVHDNCPYKIERRNPYLHRYMSFGSFMSMLETESLILHSIDLFNDRYEGFMFEILLKELLNTEEDRHIFTFKAIRECSKRFVFASCWYQSHIESAGMWDRYAKNDGIAIQTTYSRLRDCIKSGIIDYSFTPTYKPNPNSPRYNPNPFTPMIIAPVEYIYYDRNHTLEIRDNFFIDDWAQPSVTTIDKLKIVRDHLKDKSMHAADLLSDSSLEYFSKIHRDCYSFKRRDFESEKEVRVITCYNLNLMRLFTKSLEKKEVQDSILGILFRDSSAFAPVIRLTIDVKKLINKIIISPTAFNTFTETVKSVIAKSELDNDIVVESSLKKDDGIWFR